MKMDGQGTDSRVIGLRVVDTWRVLNTRMKTDALRTNTRLVWRKIVVATTV